MTLDEYPTDELLLGEIGHRIARNRLERNMTQERLAFEAGVSKPTIERIEAGASVRLETFLRVVRALGLLPSLDTLVPEPLPSPIERMKRRGNERRRAGVPRTSPVDDTTGWTWGSDEDA